MNIFTLFSGIEDPDNTTGAIPCFYETIIRDLEKSGNKLFVHVTKDFMANYDNMPVNLLNKIKEFNPDLFILFNNTFYDISKDFDCPIIIYEVDTPLIYANKNSLKTNISRYKFITCQDESIKILEEEFGANKKNILKVPFFTEIQAENIQIKHNISFIGTKFTESNSFNIFNNYMMQKPSADEIEQFKNLIREFRKNTFVTKDELLNKLNISSEKIIKVLNLHDLIFYLSDYDRVKTLSVVSDLDLALYGTTRWITDTYNDPNLILSYIDKPVYSLKHNQDIYNSTKIGININHLQAISGFSWRVCDVLASNACLVSEYKPNIEKYFGKTGIQMFTNPYDAREICKKLLANENMRKDIVSVSHEIIEEKFRFKYVKKDIEDFLGISLSNNSNITYKTKYYVDPVKDWSKDRVTFAQQIFSIKNSEDKRHKILRVLGAKLKIKRGKND